MTEDNKESTSPTKIRQVVVPILISGKAQAGKDTFADTAIEFINKGKFPLVDASKIAFADSLKDIAKQMMWDSKKDIKGRDLLIGLGGLGRQYREDLWIVKLIQKIESISRIPRESLLSNLLNGIHFVFIPDCRYLNELEAIKRSFDNTETIRVNRVNFDNGLTEEQKADVSETQLDCYTAWNTVLTNDSLDEYKARACEVTIDIIERNITALIRGFSNMYTFRGNTGDA